MVEFDFTHALAIIGKCNAMPSGNLCKDGAVKLGHADEILFHARFATRENDSRFCGHGKDIGE